MRNTITIVACIALMLVTDTATSSSRIIDIVDELSSSTYAGRLTGTPGNELASHYVAIFHPVRTRATSGLMITISNTLSQLGSMVHRLAIWQIKERYANRCNISGFSCGCWPRVDKQGTVEGPGVILRG